MKNKAHMESKEQRLARLKDNSPVEVIETLVNSIGNFLNNEIALTSSNHQTTLLFLGIHASILTISEALFGVAGEEGYKKFLEKFIDGETKDTKFSQIGSILHDWRNILAHQWLGSAGHKIQYNYKMNTGWKKNGNIITINPKIYCDHYLNAFSSSGKIWGYESVLSEKDLEKAKQVIISKYKRR